MKLTFLPTGGVFVEYVGMVKLSIAVYPVANY